MGEEKQGNASDDAGSGSDSNSNSDSDSDSGSDSDEEPSRKEAERLLQLWKLVNDCCDDDLTDALESFNLKQTAVSLEQRARTSVTAAKDLVAMEVNHFVALFAEQKNCFSVAMVKRIFKWKTGVILCQDHQDEVSLGDGHNIFFVVEFWGPLQGGSQMPCIPISQRRKLHAQVYNGNAVATAAGKDMEPSVDVVGVSQLAWVFPSLTKGNTLRVGVFSKIVKRVEERDAQRTH